MGLSFKKKNKSVTEDDIEDVPPAPHDDDAPPPKTKRPSKFSIRKSKNDSETNFDDIAPEKEKRPSKFSIFKSSKKEADEEDTHDDSNDGDLSPQPPKQKKSLLFKPKKPKNEDEAVDGEEDEPKEKRKGFFTKKKKEKVEEPAEEEEVEEEEKEQKSSFFKLKKKRSSSKLDEMDAEPSQIAKDEEPTTKHVNAFGVPIPAPPATHPHEEVYQREQQTQPVEDDKEDYNKYERSPDTTNERTSDRYDSYQEDMVVQDEPEPEQTNFCGGLVCCY